MVRPRPDLTSQLFCLRGFTPPIWMNASNSFNMWQILKTLISSAIGKSRQFVQAAIESMPIKDCHPLQFSCLHHKLPLLRHDFCNLAAIAGSACGRKSHHWSTSDLVITCLQKQDCNRLHPLGLNYSSEHGFLMDEKWHWSGVDDVNLLRHSRRNLAEWKACWVGFQFFSADKSEMITSDI